MFDGDHVIPKNHLWYRNSKFLGHLIDGSGSRDRKLSYADLEALLEMRYSRPVFGIWGWKRFSDGTAESHGVR